MSRAVILPTPGDPILLSYWIRNYATWSQYVDKLYVMVTWPTTPEVEKRIDADVKYAGGRALFAVRDRFDHGQAIDRLLIELDETHVVLMEDDVYVRKPEAIEGCFARVESGDIGAIGSPRGSSSMEIVNAAIARGHADGAALWPHLLFARTRDLTELTEGFTCRTWEPGETVLGLDHVCLETCYSDTGVAATIELRSKLSIGEIPSNVGDGGDPDWFHVGSLSTGPYPRYADGDTPLEAARRDPPAWSRRNAWWRRCLEAWPGGLPDYVATYADAVDGLSEICGRFEPAREARYAELVTW